MKGMFLKGRSAATALCASVALGLLGMASARAEYVQCETPFISGASLDSLAGGVTGSSLNTHRLVWGSAASVSALSVAGKGTVHVSLTDMGWTQALSSLDLLVTDMNGVWKSRNGAGDILVDVDGPTKLFAAVFATSDGTVPGLYSLRANFTPVPLPAAVWLLLSAIGGLTVFKRKR